MCRLKYVSYLEYIFIILNVKLKMIFVLQDYLGEMLIHKAARVGSMECVSLLISQGASLG